MRDQRGQITCRSLRETSGLRLLLCQRKNRARRGVRRIAERFIDHRRSEFRRTVATFRCRGEFTAHGRNRFFGGGNRFRRSDGTARRHYEILSGERQESAGGPGARMHVDDYPLR